jgi:nicotinamidase-related amidase
MITIEPSRTAVLAMDFQADIVARVADQAPPALERAAAVLAAARKARLPVIYVVVGFRPGYPELSPRNPNYERITQSKSFVSDPPGSDIAPAVAPAPGDPIVVKHRVSAFSDTDLATILRAKGIDTLVLFGIATSGVVLSTVRHGADADYRLVVIKDCCIDGDEEVHRVLTEKVLARQATVVTASEIIGALGGG